jgi:hypothetical protein
MLNYRKGVLTRNSDIHHSERRYSYIDECVLGTVEKLRADILLRSEQLLNGTTLI